MLPARLRGLTATAVLALTLALGACAAASPDPSQASGRDDADAAGPAGSEGAAVPPDQDELVVPVDCDPSGHLRPDAVALLAPGTWGIGGWSHATLSPELALDRGRYTIGGDNYRPAAECGDERVLSLVLVRKLVDWDRGHVNGFEARLADVTFADVSDVVLELRLVPQETVLPSDDELVAAVRGAAPAADVAGLDAQTVDLGLTLYGPAGELGTRNAGAIVSLDPAELGDGWVRVRVQARDLEHWTELDYERTPVDADEHADLAVAGLRVNPESTTGRGVRHLLGDDWVPGAVPEVLKEMAFDLALLEVGLG